MTSALARLALNIALSDVGKAEEPKGSNWGPFVRECLASVGITFPAAWCMAFIYHSFNRAARQLKVPSPLIRTGGVLKAWNEAKANRVEGLPEAGDIGILDHGKGLGHAVIVVEVVGDKVKTVEGNTNDDGSREGYEVAIRTRSIASFKGFLRY